MSTEPRRVLIVDDEPAVGSLIERQLSGRGLCCRSATHPQRARELLEQCSWRVLVCDVAMPDGGGIDLLRWVRRRRPECRVILITGLTDTEPIVRALQLGAFDYFQKPLEIPRLAAAVMRAIRTSDTEPYLTLRAARAIQQEVSSSRTSLESIRALVRAVEAKDPYTRRHSEQVAHYAVHLARRAGLGEIEVERVRVAAMLHDVGKIGVPDEVLTKPAKLTAEEFGLIRAHPALGADILRNISMFSQEAKLVRHHHENYDGTGYPDGLAGEAIPFGSRIIQVADCIDAMLMRRTYKAPYPLERVLMELSRNAGGQFDPDIAAAAQRWLRHEPEQIIMPEEAAAEAV